MGAFTSYLALAGIGMQAYGQYQSGQDAAAAAVYNANLYNQQASIIETKKGLTREEYDRMIDRIEGESIVAVAGSGYDLSGSFLAVMNDTLTQAQLDKQKAIYNLDIEKSQAKSSAEEYSRAGVRARHAANTQAVTTVLTQGNEWYAKYGGFGKTKD